MRPVIEVREAKPWHCGQALRAMRPAHRRALEKLGAHQHQELRTIFNASTIRKVCFFDGKLAAVGGVTGSLASNMGYVWLVLTETALQYPIETFRRARLELAVIMETQFELATTVVAEDPAAVRFALALGFHTRDEEIEKNRKALAARIIADETLRLSLGNGFVIPLGYHASERV
jgi:hypothetical protein